VRTAIGNRCHDQVMPAGRQLAHDHRLAERPVELTAEALAATNTTCFGQCCAHCAGSSKQGSLQVPPRSAESHALLHRLLLQGAEVASLNSRRAALSSVPGRVYYLGRVSRGGQGKQLLRHLCDVRT
jgi:hypothetical protein